MKINKNRHRLCFIFSLIMIMALAGCNQDSNNINQENNSEAENKTEESDTLTDPIIEKIDSMSIEERIGQMLMFGFEDTQVNDETRKLIVDYHVGGVILSKKNITGSEQLLDLNNQIKEINSDHNNTPIFISVDEEGGLISRMPPEIINLPNSKDIGDSHRSELAYQVGEAIGERVSSFGFNMTMAPVLDINSNPANPVIGKRAFGDNKEIVSEMGIEEMKGIQSQNIIPVVKHFPGHGDTDVDSHLRLPVVNHGLGKLRQMELVPFQNAVNQQADMTMVAHLLLPEIDSKYPSSLSKNVITNILREELKFNGVVITDDMAMGAIIENYDIGEASIKAVQAGNDIVLVVHGYENKVKVVNSLINAVKDGTISEARIDESVERILHLKEKYNISDSPIDEIEINKINQSSEEILGALQ
ncbi:beta-N-acetylhexosaminidase [Cytobacillus firmus]|uniref:beta-N-acetylhexosaminidase n=2 Tax=Cytobacillus TaxID=2675230 RepID=A0A366JF14_CYTFI|nr:MULTISPECIES: glycoside hydrolase family 3 protein [Cytobacillus]RBP84458.1 beta-N-acetylhexosaminidase [Cytobacillus firmus]TDX35953.1 beta-N-acetylhexosaminidase [Cytobacillus oceanisediminis]